MDGRMAGKTSGGLLVQGFRGFEFTGFPQHFPLNALSRNFELLSYAPDTFRSHFGSRRFFRWALVMAFLSGYGTPCSVNAVKQRV